jgi:D-alanyl-lipoteichoic acid acyltransferase DltB (MBOAT superfamily)
MIITFLLSGLWHGAGWTFVIWGLYQGIFIVISMNSQKYRRRFEKKYHLKNNQLYDIFRMIFTFGIVCLGLVFFRAESISIAFEYVSNIFSLSLFTIPPRKILGSFSICLLIGAFIAIEWIGRNNQYAIESLGVGWKKPYRWAMYLFIVFLLFMFMKTEETPFIYFQF